MLRISSFKAFVISNLLQFFLPFALVPILMDMGGPPHLRDLRTFDGVLALQTSLSVILSSLIAGFIAGRIAEYRPVLHGALSGCFSLIETLDASLRVPSSALFPTSLSITLAFAALLFGALGGYGAPKWAVAQAGTMSRRCRELAS
jgi:putative membrane protein (TIGR04086 family)